MKDDHAIQVRAGIAPPKGWLRRLVEPSLRAMGVEPIPVWDVSNHAHNYVHAQLLRELFEAKAIDCVFDVGAFNGHFGNFLRKKVGFSGTILSFEPQPEPFRALEEVSSRDERWHAFPVALGAEPGEFEMNVMNKLWFSSFLAPSAATPQNMASRNTVESKIRARIERLADRFDALAATHGFTRPFLKMDTQGFDLQVLQGALPRIERFLGLQSEVAVIQIYVGMPDWKEALAEYQKAGFALCAFFPVSRDGQMRAVELDVVMVRND
ncbi:MAG TPA: FkbM family methyltransferase [Burkholderiales bacterium]|nr:FkbM family methyltransferase [Burkholderiales bacterium]